MGIPIDTAIIHASLATVINRVQPGANIYDNPNQQGTVYPAWFIVHRSPVEVRRDFTRINGGNRYEVTYSIDLWHMLQQNITCLYDQYSKVAETLDANIEYLPLFGTDGIVLHVYDRSWSLELNAMKYSLTLRFHCYMDNKDYQFTPCEVIEDVGTYIRGEGPEPEPPEEDSGDNTEGD